MVVTNEQLLSLEMVSKILNEFDCTGLDCYECPLGLIIRREKGNVKRNSNCITIVMDANIKRIKKKIK